MPIHIAIIGKGKWGSKLINGFSLRKDLFNVKHVANSKYDLQKIWDDRSVEGIVIATPNNTHIAIAEAALYSGKHVWVEKPLCETYEDTLFIQDVAEEADKTVYTDYIMTLSPSIQHMAKLVVPDQVNYVNIAICRNSDSDSDCYDVLGSHAISITEALGLKWGYGDCVSKNLRMFGKKCVTSIIGFHLGDDGIGSIYLDTEAPSKETKVSIYQRGFHLHYNMFDTIPLKCYGEGDNNWCMENDEFRGIDRAITHWHDILCGKIGDNLELSEEVSAKLQRLRINNVI